MPVFDPAAPVKRGTIRGRESRNQTLATKLTEAEHRAVEKAAQADGKTAGGWLRDLALRALQNDAQKAEMIALSEVVGVCLLLVNVLRSLGTGQKLTPEAFDTLLNEIGIAKHDLAAKPLSERGR